MAKKKAAAHGGGHGWFVTFADLMGLLVAFFVMLVAFSTPDQKQLQIMAGSMREAFGVQTEARFTGVREIEGMPRRKKPKSTTPNTEDNPDSTATEEQQRSKQANKLQQDRAFALATAS